MLVFLLQFVFLVAQAARAAAFPYDLLMAYDANHLEIALRVLAGDWSRIYSPAHEPGFLMSGYTPLHFFVLAPLVALFGPLTMIPRWLALVSFVLFFPVVWRGVGRHGMRAERPVVLLLTFHLMLELYGPVHFGTVDPPMILLSTLAFLAAASGLETRRGAVGVGLLAGLAFLMKQPAAFTGLAIALFGLLCHRRTLFAYLLAWILSAGIPCVLINHLTDGALLYHTVHVMSRIIILDYWKLWYEAVDFGFNAGPALVIGLGGLVFGARRRPLETLSCIMIAVWIIGVFPMLAKDGTSNAYLTPIVPAMAILAAAALRRLAEVGRTAAAGLLLIFLLAITPNAMTVRWPLPDAVDLANGARLEAIVRATSGPILFDRHHGFILEAGRRPEYDLALIWWLERRAGISAAFNAIRDIQAGRYELIAWSGGYPLPEIEAAIHQAYERTDDPVIERNEPGRPWYRFELWRRRAN